MSAKRSNAPQAARPAVPAAKYTATPTVEPAFLVVIDAQPDTALIVDGEQLADLRQRAERATDGNVGVQAWPIEQVLRAVNAHEALMEACRKAYELTLAPELGQDTITVRESAEVQRLCIAALALAEGGPS